MTQSGIEPAKFHMMVSILKYHNRQVSGTGNDRAFHRIASEA
jgi:hypothetical protein